MKKESDELEDEFEDEIKPEDGLVRYWTFLNGEQFSLISALAAAFFGVLWCFLYILGVGQSMFGIVLFVLAGISFLAWQLFGSLLRSYQENDWKKDRRSPKRVKIEICVAIALWLFIFGSIGLIIFGRWRHGH